MNKKDIFMLVIGLLLGTSITVYAYNYYAKDISFEPSDESWEVDNVGSAINDLYTNQNETIVDYEKTITSQNTKISNYESTITQKDSTISNLNSQITSLKNELSTFTSSKCVSGTFVCTSCTTSEGQKIVDFEPSVFYFYRTTSSTAHTVWYYDARLNTNGWRVYTVTSSETGYTFATTMSSYIKFDNGLIFYGTQSSNANKTFYYMACE